MKKFVMYLGPAIKGVTRKNQIFNYDPKEIKEKVGAILPASQYLFVDLEDIATKKKELNTPGTVLFQAYEQLETRVKV